MLDMQTHLTRHEKAMKLLAEIEKLDWYIESYSFIDNGGAEKLKRLSRERKDLLKQYHELLCDLTSESYAEVQKGKEMVKTA